MHTARTRVTAAATTFLFAAGLLAAVATPAEGATVKATRTSVTVARTVAGHKVTIAARVSPRPGGGTVRFSIGRATLGRCGKVVAARGVARCTTTFPTPGTRTVAATYSGRAKLYRSSVGRARVFVAAPRIVGGTGSCTTSAGALAAVSFAPWNGPIVRGCSTSLSSGRALLTSAGFTLTDVARQPGFICRIGNPLYANGARYPTAAQDPCRVTPPAGAYWSFWTAAKGVNAWTYSPRGAVDDRPANGEVEFWTYGRTGKPVVTPNQVRAGLRTGTAAARLSARTLAAARARPNLTAAAGYLVGRLVGGTHYQQNGAPDYGLTIDAALALAGTGGHESQLRAIAGYLAQHVDAYTFLNEPPGDAGRVGKLALLAESVGGDPRAFSGRNLIAALRTLECKAAIKNVCAGRGAYPYVSSTFGQALAVLAQLRAGVTPASALASLETLQGASGGFASNTDGSVAETDSTALAAMTLSLVPDAQARGAAATALAWLARRQRSDGGFPGAAGNSVNSAALAIQALTLDAGRYGAQIVKGQRFLAAAQNGDGGFDVTAGVNGSDLRASAQAVSGSAGVPFGSVFDHVASRAQAGRGATYLVGQLVDGNHYNFSGSTTPDYGLTADGLFALLRTGGHSAAAIAMAEYLRDNVDNYADASAKFGGPYSGGLAKLALVAQATGADPHSFGGVNLLGLLRQKVCTAQIAGQFSPCTAAGDFYNAFSSISQSLGVLALQASGRAADHLTFGSAPVTRLRHLQCADGGFSSELIKAGAKCTSDVDATGYAVQALATVQGADATLGKAQHYLEHAQKLSGLFPGQSGDNSNSTALAALGLQTLVTSLRSGTPPARGPKTAAPIVAWQQALRGLGTLAVASGGYGQASRATADLRSSAQAVLAAAQGTLVSLVGATIRSAPRDAAVPAPSPGPSGSSGSASGSAPASPAGGPARPIAATGVTAGAQLAWALGLLLLGIALVITGRRRIVGRHRPTRAR